jgi:fructose-1,6-bisphosphatase/inositol monophosphatase family enzyme
MDHQFVKGIFCEIGKLVCNKVHQSLLGQTVEELSGIHEDHEDDTIYNIDRDVEKVIVPVLARYAEKLGGIVLIAEGIGKKGEEVVMPEGIKASEAGVRIIMDPIDGTRGIMYNKRSAFFLAGAAPNKGASTSLQDIEVAVMTELPTTKAIYSDTFWAIKGKGAEGFTRNILDDSIKPKSVSPSRSKTISGGFAQIARFFPPAKYILAKIEDELVEQLFPDAPEGKAIIFEDQYISSGGQLYEILVGHDRFTAEIREGLYRRLSKEGKKTGHCCHPYDLCAHLIGTEAGIVITGRKGEALDAPLDTTSNVDWIGYANKYIQQEVESTLHKLMDQHGILNP